MFAAPDDVEVLPEIPPFVAWSDDDEAAPPVVIAVDATEDRLVLSELPPVGVLPEPSSTPPLDTVCGLPPLETVLPLERVLFGLPPAFAFPPRVSVDPVEFPLSP